MDEKKTYLINVESNLKKYADEAAEAKKKVDELKASNDALKQSGTATTAEIEASNAALRNAQKEYTQAKKMVDLQTAANKSEIGSRKQLGEILKLQEQELGKLGKAYIVNAQGVRTLNPLYVEQRKRIAETKQAIIDYDQSLNDGRSNIGRYGESAKAAFSQAGKSILSMVSPMALITAGLAVAKKVFDGLKEAIMSTSGAMNAMNVVGQITKQMFYDVAVNGKLSAESMMAAAEAAKLMNEKRVGDRKDMIEFAMLEREIAKLEFDAADKTKTRAERQEALNLAIAKQNELSDKKIIDAKEDLKITQDLIALRPKDDKLRQQEAETIARIIKLDQERFDQSKRNEAKLTGFLQEEIDARKKLFDAYYAEIEKTNEAIDKAEEKKIADKKKQDFDAKKALQDFADDEMKRLDKEFEDRLNKEIESQREEFEQEIKTTQEQDDIRIRQEERVSEALLEIHQRTEDAKMNLASAATNFLNAIAGQNKTLQTAALIAEKAFAIAQVIIQTTKANATIRAMAAASVIPGPGYLVRLGAAMAAVTAPINMNRIAAALDIAAIVAATTMQIKSSTQTVSAVPTSIVESVPAQRNFAAQAGSTILTQPQLSQQQLNALPQQNLLTADDIAKALSRMPAPVVTVEDINAKTEQVRKVAVRANI